MNRLLNHMFLAANRSQMNVGYSHFGIITSVNATDYIVKIQLQPEEIETGMDSLFDSILWICCAAIGW
jgi:hypothetical protein